MPVSAMRFTAASTGSIEEPLSVEIPWPLKKKENCIFGLYQIGEKVHTIFDIRPAGKIRVPIIDVVAQNKYLVPPVGGKQFAEIFRIVSGSGQADYRRVGVFIDADQNRIPLAPRRLFGRERRNAQHGRTNERKRDSEHWNTIFTIHLETPAG